MNQDMKTILIRMFTVVVLMMISMATRAIDVQIVNDGKFTGGTITATQSDPKGGLVTVMLYVTPNSGYTISKSDITVVSTVPAGSRNTRGEGPKVAKALELDGDDPKNLSDKRTYTVTVGESFGVWVQSATFLPSRDSGAKTVTGQSEIIRNYEGTYYIANHNNNSYSPTDKTNNFYLCPSEIYYDWNASTPNQMPFLTTNNPDPTGRPTEPIAKWKIEYKKPIDGENDGIDYYYIKYLAPDGTEKYLVHNGIVISGKEARIRYHLQKNKDSDEDNNLFFFTQGYDKNNKLYKAFIHICPKAEASRANGASLNPAKNNYPDYEGHSDNGAESWKQGSTTLYCGGLVGHYDLNDKTGVWFLEDIVARPVVSINGDGKAEITSSDANATYKYSTDGNPPSTAYDSENPIDITDVVTIKAIAIVDGEVSNEVTYTVGNGSPYLIQNQECTAYYMVPEQKESGNISINTSSVAGPKMEWYIRNAGAVNGLQYYYIVNKATSSSSSYNYLTYTESNGTKIYFASNTDKLPSGDAYKFYFRPNTDGSYSIYPKGVWDKSFHKDQENRAYPIIVISSSVTLDQAKWKFIPSSDYAYVVPTDDEGNSLSLSSESSGAAYYYVASVGTGDSYIVSNAATSTSGSNQDKSWMLMEAGTDSWQTYYYIVSAATGKYMHFLGTADDTSTLTNAVEMTDLPASPSDNYKFVLARATDANTYYIIPKTHYECFEANKFYCLSNTGSQINAELTRASKNNTNEDINAKWKFSSTTLFCASPIAKLDNEGNVTLSCPTFGSEIRFTTDGKSPDTEGATTNTYNNESWSASVKTLIKAVARLKSNTTVVSQDGITILNNPNVTLSQDSYTYNGSAQTPTISEVSITTINGEKTTATVGTDFETVESTDYSNNINAGTAKVTLRDKASNVYVWHAEKEFKINPKEVGLTWDPDDSGQTTFTYSGLAQAPTVTATELIGTDVCAVTVNVTDDEGSSLPNDEAINVGSYIATASPLENTNYKLPDAKTRAFTITQAPVTVTADDKTKGYGDPEPEWTATVTGMVNGENPSLIVYTVSREPGNENGTYAIIPSGAVEQGNYTVTYVNGTLTIDAKKPLNKDNAGTPADGIIIDVTSNGTAYQVVVTHKKVDEDYELVEGTDYTWGVDQGHTEYDVVTVTGCGSNYTGSAKAIYIKLTFYDTTPNAVTDPEETAAAYYATQNLQLSERIEAWYVTSLSNNVLAFKEVKVGEGNDKISYIPANQPVLLFGNSSSTGFMLKPYTGTTMEIPATGDEANILKVVTEDAGKAVNLGEVYVFSKGEFVLTMAGTLTKGKVYLDNPSYNSSSLSRGTLSASRGETTGIIDVRLSNNQFSEVWYALDGQKYNKKPTRKGIYLQNGKKVVIK